MSDFIHDDSLNGDIRQLWSYIGRIDISDIVSVGIVLDNFTGLAWDDSIDNCVVGISECLSKMIIYIKDVILWYSLTTT